MIVGNDEEFGFIAGNYDKGLEKGAVTLGRGR